MEKQMNEVEKYLETKLAEEQNKKLELSKEKETKQKKSHKGLIISIVALMLAVAAAITCAIGLKKKKNTTDEIVPQTSITMGVDDLGKEEEIIEEVDKQYVEVTGAIKKEELVEKNEVIWKDQEAADKSEEVGKVEIDLQGGSLIVDNTGDVVETTPSYEVKDETGKVVEEGTNETGIPEGYAFDEVLNKIVPVEEVGKYVCVDTDYYTLDGEVIFVKGDLVLKETLTKMQEQLTTVKPEIKVEEPTIEPEEDETEIEEDEPKLESEITMPSGKVNRDGTYTITYEIDGEVTSVTYMDKATYEEWLVDEYSSDNFGFYEGIIYPIEVIEEMSRQNRR